jgi:hypothetical protein
MISYQSVISFLITAGALPLPTETTDGAPSLMQLTPGPLQPNLPSTIKLHF